MGTAMLMVLAGLREHATLRESQRADRESPCGLGGADSEPCPYSYSPSSSNP